MFLRNKAGLQSHFENNSIMISKEGTSPPPGPQPPRPPPLLWNGLLVLWGVLMGLSPTHGVCTDPGS